MGAVAPGPAPVSDGARIETPPEGGRSSVITLTLLKGEKIVLNAELIESLEATPDTVITLTTGKKIVVRESVGEVAGKVENYTLRRRAHAETA